MNLQADKSLIGREAQFDQLDRHLGSGAGRKKRVALLSGPPGIGKSTLARIAIQGLAAEGWTVSTKFDQYLTTRPAGFFVDALAAIAECILALPETQRGKIRASLVDAISPNGQLVINLCPRMSDVLGAQPELITLAPQENQAVSYTHLTLPTKA